MRTKLRGTASADKALVPLDTAGIRSKALESHARARKAVEKIRSQLKRYHERDIQGFQAWVHRAFGPLLARHREVLKALDEKRSLLQEVGDLVQWRGLSEVEAYRKALWRKQHPAEAEAEDRRYEEELEREARKRSAARESEDADADDPFTGDFDIPDEDEADKWEAIRDVFERLTGIHAPDDAFRRKGAQLHPDGRTAKEVYRAIVRRLHPDHHGHMSEARKALWHDAQEAYRRQDLNALYSVLARCDGGETGLGRHSPVSLILRLTHQLQEAAREARRELRRAKGDIAWDYETKTRDPRFIRRVENDLARELRDAEWQLRDMSEILAMLDETSRRRAPVNVPQHPPRRPPQRRRPTPSQPDLPF